MPSAGSFSGANRDIPLRSGESIDDVSVLENGRAFATGGCVELGCSSPPGTFGVTRSGGTERIVWHYSATDEVRTFEIRYRMRGLAVAYDDVVDVNLQVWGDQWDQSLGRLTATTTGPGDVVRAWGHPVWVRGDVTIDGPSAHLRALNVSSHQFVELRTLYPRGAFTSTAGMRVVSGNGLEKIAAEELSDARAYERDKERIDDAIAPPVADGPDRPGARRPARARHLDVRLLALRTRALARATTASTSRSRRPTRRPRSCRRCCGRVARRARSSSPRPSST